MPEGIASIIVVVALTSAFLHAAWNAAVKASTDPRGAMAAQVIGSGALALPVLIFLPLPALGGSAMALRIGGFQLPHPRHLAARL